MNPSEAVAILLDIPLDDVLVLQSAHVKLILAAARGEVDLNALAREEMANRGIDSRGRWVGFDEARRLAMQTHPAATADHQVR